MMYEDVLKSLALDQYSGTLSKNGAYVVDLYSDLDFGKVYSTLEENEDVD